MIKKYLLGFVVFLFYWALSKTWKIEIQEPNEMKKLLAEKVPILLSHWHGDELFLISLVRRYRIATITSLSKDGTLMNVVLRLLGAKTARGSSSRGGVQALKGLIQLAKLGYNCSFAVDGPRGPIYEVKPGVFELSKILSISGGGSIFAAGVCVDRFWSFPRSWNKTYLPKPFAKIKIIWVYALPSLKKTDDPKSLELKKSLEVSLHHAKELSLRNI